jgi:hypothetical protein
MVTIDGLMTICSFLALGREFQAAEKVCGDYIDRRPHINFTRDRPLRAQAVAQLSRGKCGTRGAQTAGG